MPSDHFPAANRVSRGRRLLGKPVTASDLTPSRVHAKEPPFGALVRLAAPGLTITRWPQRSGRMAVARRAALRVRRRTRPDADQA